MRPQHDNLPFLRVKNNGFTLVELVTVMVILSIMAAVAIPRFFETHAYKSREFYEEVINAARYSQKLAVASGCAVQLSVSGSGFSLHQRQNCKSGNYNREVTHPADHGAFTAATPSGVSLSSTAAAIVFDGLGRATPGGTTISVDSRSFTLIGESGYADEL